MNVFTNDILIQDMSSILDFTKITTEFDKLEFGPNLGNSTSINKLFFNNPLFKNEKNILINECKTFLNTYFNMSGYYEDIQLTNSWANISKPGEFHHEHKHPYSVVSGIIYMDNNPSNLNLKMEIVRPHVPYFVYNKVSHMFSLHDLFRDGAQVNHLKHHLILFLSNCVHLVEPVPIYCNPRRSLSFNTFWKGRVGHLQEELASMKFDELNNI